MDEDNGRRGTRIDRRKAIKQGAAAAGVIWAVPAIQSFTNPAGAQQAGTPPPDGDCEDGVVMHVFVKYEVDTGSFVAANQLNDGTCVAGGCAAANAWAAAQMNAAAVVQADGDRRVCITIPDDFLMVYAAAAHKGNNGCDTTPDPGSDIANGTVCFDKETDTPNPGGGVSSISIEISACVPKDVAASCP